MRIEETRMCYCAELRLDFLSWFLCQKFKIFHHKLIHKIKRELKSFYTTLKVH